MERMIHYSFLLGLVSLTLGAASIGFESYHYRLINNILESVEEPYGIDFTVFCTSCGEFLNILSQISKHGLERSTAEYLTGNV